MEKFEHTQEKDDTEVLMKVTKQNHDMEMDVKELEVEKKQKRNVSIG